MSTVTFNHDGTTTEHQTYIGFRCGKCGAFVKIWEPYTPPITAEVHVARCGGEMNVDNFSWIKPTTTTGTVATFSENGKVFAAMGSCIACHWMGRVELEEEA